MVLRRVVHPLAGLRGSRQTLRGRQEDRYTRTPFHFWDNHLSQDIWCCASTSLFARATHRPTSRRPRHSEAGRLLPMTRGKFESTIAFALGDLSGKSLRRASASGLRTRRTRDTWHQGDGRFRFNSSPRDGDRPNQIREGS